MRIVLADPVGSRARRLGRRTGVAGPDAAYQVEGIGGERAAGHLDRGVIDAAESVTDEESFAMARPPDARGGAARRRLGGHRRRRGAARRGARRLDGPVVALLPDSWDRYLSTPWVRAL